MAGPSGTWENTVHRLDHSSLAAHVLASRSQIHALSAVRTSLPRNRTRYIGTSHALSSVHPKKERADTHTCRLAFYSRIAHIPDHTSTSSSTSRVCTRSSCTTKTILTLVLDLVQFLVLSRPVLSCHCLSACILDSLIAIWSRSSFSSRRFISLTDSLHPNGNGSVSLLLPTTTT